MKGQLAACYVRVGPSEEGAVEPQKEAVLRYCHEKGLGVAGVYVDEGVTGYVPFEDRDAARLLLKDARQHTFDVVVVYQYNRIGHDVASVARVAVLLDDLKIGTLAVMGETREMPMKLQVVGGRHEGEGDGAGRGDRGDGGRPRRAGVHRTEVDRGDDTGFLVIWPEGTASNE